MLRACYPHNFEGTIVYDVKSNRFKGAVSYLINESLDTITQGVKSAIKNASILIQPTDSLKIAGANSQNYEGCVTALQVNKSDFLLALAAHPVDAEGINQELIVYETAIAIGAPYIKDIQSEISQVLSSFSSFSSPLWLMCLFTFLCIFVTLHARNSMGRKQRNHYSFYYSATHVTRLNQMSDLGTVRRYIFLAASIYSLVIVHCFCSLIKTELVAVKEPAVMRSYQDVIDRGARPLFLKGTAYAHLFSNPSAPGYRRRFWEYATTKFLPEDVFFEMHPRRALITGLGFLLGKQVAIMSSLGMPFAAAVGCPPNALASETFLQLIESYKKRYLSPLQPGSPTDATTQYIRRYILQFKDVHFDRMPTWGYFTAIDPNEKGYQLAILTNQLSGNTVLDQLKKTVRRTFETGIFLRIQGQIKYFDGFKPMVDALGGLDPSKQHLVQECASDRLLKPETEYHSLTLENFKSLFILVACVIPILFLILILENAAA